jgi:hypothetical protein
MKLKPNWKEVVRKAWSVRFMVIAGILSGCEVALPLIGDAFPKNIFALLSFLFVSAAFVARLIAQKDVT